jgi:DNA gyrase/topoisomerase IV subunit B
MTRAPALRSASTSLAHSSATVSRDTERYKIKYKKGKTLNIKKVKKDKISHHSRISAKNIKVCANTQIKIFARILAEI